MAEKKEKDKKVKRPTPLKRDLQNEKRALQNKSLKSKIKTALRSFEEALKSKDKGSIDKGLNSLYSLMDRGIKKGVLKPNKGDRTKAKAAARAALIA